MSQSSAISTSVKITNIICTVEWVYIYVVLWINHDYSTWHNVFPSLMIVAEYSTLLELQK